MSKEQKKQKENEMIDQQFQLLLNDYLASPHGKKVDIIQKAYQFAKNAHEGIRRLSGEPYILHPIAVAQIVCKEIGLGSTSICAALLHDVVEDTEYTTDDIRNLFGDKIAEIVEGLTKISGGVFGEQASEQAENFRKLLITMSQDIRVILVKLADRLHNMRTLDSQPTAKQYKIAGETEYLYAPLAHRLGLFEIKAELENLSFKYNFPRDYMEIEQRLNSERARRMELYDRFALPIMNKMNEYGYQFVMKDRIKSVHSIWKKMKAKHIPYEEVYDILGARIVFTPLPGADEKMECWKIYNIITQIYPPHPERTRDWLNKPKSTGYEALHVTVMGPDGFWIEVQIRSKRMDDIAEKGLAAHWTYKQDYTNSETKIEEWLQTVNELLKNPDSNAMSFLDTFKLTLYEADMIVFTPQGEMKTIQTGSTALDFAFEIHTDIGMHAIAAKVNNKLVPLSYTLNSGDQIEILTSAKAQPNPEWLQYVTTARAKEKINSAIRQSTKPFIERGDTILRNALRYIGHPIKQDYPANVIKRLVEFYKVESLDELCINIAENKVNLANLSDAFKTRNMLSAEYWTSAFRKKVSDSEEINAVADTDSYVVATCCCPIPGDDIIGFKRNNSQIVVHKRSCGEAIRLRSQQAQHIVTPQWTDTGNRTYPVELEISGIDRKKILVEIIEQISDKMDFNIRKLTVNTIDGIFRSMIKVDVHNTDDIKKICGEINGIEGIQSISRVE